MQQLYKFITCRLDNSATCFGHSHAHHQELQQLQWQPLVYRRSLVIALLLVVVDIQGPPKKCIHNLTKENSMLYVSTKFNYTSQVEYKLQ